MEVLTSAASRPGVRRRWDGGRALPRRWARKIAAIDLAQASVGDERIFVRGGRVRFLGGSCAGGIRGFDVEAEFGEGGLGLLGLDLAVAREAGECGADDGFGVDLEVAAEVLAVVAAAEAVGAEGGEAALAVELQPGREDIGQGLHVVAGGDDGALGAFEGGFDVGLALGLGGMQAVPALGGDGLAAQLGVAGDAPDIGGDLVLFGENLLRAQDLVEDGAGAEELDGCLAVGGGAEFVDAA